MQERYVVIREGEEIKRVCGVDYYNMKLVPPEIVFYDEHDNEIDRMDARIGDVIQPVTVGFYNPFPPIDQSDAKLSDLRRQYREATGIDCE
jgi:hypothetical protein